MKKLPLIFLCFGINIVWLMGCPVWEAAVEDRANEVSTETSSSTTVVTISVTPSNITVINGSSTTFSASGAVTPITWSFDDATLGSVDSSTGIFIASASNTGSGTVTVTDADGNSGSTTVTVS